MKNYYQNELNPIFPSMETGKIKIKTETTETKWLNLNTVSIKVLIQALTEKLNQWEAEK